MAFGSVESIEIASSVNSSEVLANVSFAGAALSVESLDNLLAGVAAKSGEKESCILLVPAKGKWFEGWKALAAPLLDGEEKSNAPKRCFGVYRNGLRKAYMTHEVMKGLMLLLY